MQPWEPSQTKNMIPNYKHSGRHLESQTLSHRRHFVTFEMDSQTNALWFDTSGRARKYPLTPQRSFRMTFLWARETDRESECKKHRKRGKGQKREKTSNHSLLPSSSGSWLADSSLVDFSVALGHGYITHTWKLLSRLSLIAERARLGWKWRDIACVRNQRGGGQDFWYWTQMDFQPRSNTSQLFKYTVIVPLSSHDKTQEKKRSGIAKGRNRKWQTAPLAFLVLLSCASP